MVKYLKETSPFLDGIIFVDEPKWKDENTFCGRRDYNHMWTTLTIRDLSPLPLEILMSLRTLTPFDVILLSTNLYVEGTARRAFLAFLAAATSNTGSRKIVEWLGEAHILVGTGTLIQPLY